MGILTHFPANATTLPPPKSREQRIYDAAFAATVRAVMGQPAPDHTHTSERRMTDDAG